MPKTKVTTICIISLLVLSSNAAQSKRFMPKSTPTFAESLNSLGISLHNTFAVTKNIVFSPWCIAYAMGMILLGAEGDTAKEIQKAMHLSHARTDNIHYEFGQLREHLHNYERDYEMRMFSTILVQERNPISSTFKVKLQRNYETTVHEVDFTQNGHLVVNSINAWTALKTSGKITQIISSPPSPNTLLLMLTVNYFKGLWEQPFNTADTKPVPFNNADGKKPTVYMMHSTRNISLYVGDNLALDAVDLPMKGGVSCLLLKPETPSQMAIMQKNMSSSFFEEIFKDMQEEPVELGLPKFSATSRMELEDSFKLLGIKKAFSKDYADFTGISNRGDLFLSDAYHKASVAIDEKGAEASSVTVVTIASRHKAYKLNFDSPFLFLFRDIKSGTILFMGRISNMQTAG